VVEACREWLTDHNAKSLLAHMREEEKKAAREKRENEAQRQP
jgi:hypothetical protein